MELRPKVAAESSYSWVDDAVAAFPGALRRIEPAMKAAALRPWATRSRRR